METLNRPFPWIRQSEARAPCQKGNSGEKGRGLSEVQRRGVACTLSGGCHVLVCLGASKLSN